jgi:hypothetical protein
MIFEPHKLYRKVITGAGLNGDGDPEGGTETWEETGRCRCDDNRQVRHISVNGEQTVYEYHIVHEGERIPAGTEVRALNEDGSIRGEGTVIKTGKCNYFDYSEIWL